MSKRFISQPIFCIAALAALLPAVASAEVSVPNVIGSHMVLQRDMPVPIWGDADAGEKVTVEFAGQKKETTATVGGKWSVKLDALKTNAKGETLTISGTNKIALENVLVGEVWVGSGQSNMQWSVKASINPEKEAAAANYPNIRLFQIPLKANPEPQPDVDAKWDVCTPERIPNFSGVLYFFGRKLQAELDCPVGLIMTAWGGTRVEPWTPLEGFASVPATKEIFESTSKVLPGGEGYAKNAEDYVAKFREWIPKARKQLKDNQAIPELPAAPNPMPRGHQSPVVIYNAMIHPIVPFAIRGATWYQGESNNGEGMAYFEKKKALIGGWRKVWGQGDFPFYFVQIAPYNYGGDRAASLPELWEAQNACLSIPNTGQAIINDIGNIKDIHPKNKQEVGRRLALLALKNDYGQSDLQASGPIYLDHQIEGANVRVRFRHSKGGLASRDGKKLTHFEIAGADGAFVAADAILSGDDLLVSSDKVKEPKSARFAWDQLAEPNLINKAGLPASAFRTNRPD